MKITRFKETADGGSRFEEIEVPFSQPFQDEFGNTYHLTKGCPANAVLVELPHGLDQDWHVAPNRQLVVVLTGRLEVETTDGAMRQWGPGEVLLADDTGGRGHRTRVLDGPAKLVFLKLDPGFDLDEWTRS